MALLVFNKTTSPITLSGLATVVPASALAGTRGPGVNVTSELNGLSGPQYTALEAQRGTSLDYEWSGYPEYLTGTLSTISTASYTSVVNEASLGALDGSQLPDFAEVHVATYKQPWKLNKTSAAALIANQRIAAVGGGRWERKLVGHPDWAAQTAWSMDPSAGSDEASGAPGFPIKTLAEFSRRMQLANVGTYTITLVAGAVVPSSDILRWTPQIDPSSGTGTDPTVTVNIVGTLTTPTTGSLTAVTAPVPSTNTRGTITTATVLAVGDGLRLTSGAGINGVAWVMKDLGAGVYATSRWINPATGNLVTFPSAADTFAVDTFPTIACTIVDQKYRCQIGLTNVLLTPPTNGLGPANFPGPIYTRVKVTHAGGSFFGPINGDLASRGFQLRGCLFQLTTYGVLGTMRIGLGTWSFQGSAFINCKIPAHQIVGGLAGMQYANCEFQNSSLGATETPPINGESAWAGSTQIGAVCGFWDSTTDPAITVRRMARFSCGNTAAVGATPFYGTGNNAAGGAFRCDDGGVMMLASTQTPTLTGTTELNFEASATAIPPLVAGAAVPAASALTTWAQWKAAPFSGNVFSTRSGAAIFTAAAT